MFRYLVRSHGDTLLRLHQRVRHFSFLLVILAVQVYSVRIHGWPTLDNPWRDQLQDQFTESEAPKIPYEVSKEDFKWVRKVLPNSDAIPLPRENLPVPSPSGWIPPNPQISCNYPYSVRRSKNHMLPVYYKEKQRKLAERAHGIRSLTVIRHVDGDMWALAEDLRVLLEPKCEGGVLLCQVDESTRQIKIEGLFLEDVAQFLLDRGF